MWRGITRLHNITSFSDMGRAEQGFTLVEVMAALFVVALAISGLLLQMMTYGDNTAYLRDKAIAHWVALNQLELERLANRHSNRLLNDEKSGVEQMAEREWYWRIKPKKTAATGFLQLEVSVFQDQQEKNPVVSISGHIDQFHRLGEG